MPFPQFPKDHKKEVIITPKQHFSTESQDYQDFQCPKSVIVCFESSVMDHYKEKAQLEHRKFWTGELIYLDQKTKNLAIVGNFGLGGPAAAHMLEILIAAGAEQFVVVGHAGGLQVANPVGSLVLVDRAIRDEGLSHHYVKNDKFAYPSKRLTAELEKALHSADLKFDSGTSWTLDSMYRETKEEVNFYINETVLSVEMEIASLFAVATFREVQIAAIVTISDLLIDNSWDEYLNHERISRSLMNSIRVAEKVLV